MWYVEVRSDWTAGGWTTIGMYATEDEAQVRFKYERKRHKKSPYIKHRITQG